MNRTKRYLLSTGSSTDKVEYYILDLFKVYLNIFPGDIPGDDQIGFDFIMTNTKKADLADDIRRRVEILISKLQKKVSNVKISLVEAALINETTVKIVVDVNQIRSEEILVDLYKNN